MNPFDLPDTSIKIADGVWIAPEPPHILYFREGTGISIPEQVKLIEEIYARNN